MYPVGHDLGPNMQHYTMPCSLVSKQDIGGSYNAFCLNSSPPCEAVVEWQKGEEEWDYQFILSAC